MTIKTKVLNLLGLAYRARKVIRGEENVVKSMQLGKIRMVFVASDSSKRTIDKFSKKCFFYNVPVVFDYSTDELSNAIGRPMCKILAITDQGFYEALKNIINRGGQNEG